MELSPRPSSVGHCGSTAVSEAPPRVESGGGAAPVGEPMARGINRLTARFVAAVTDEGRYSDGGGLYLIVRQRGKEPEKTWQYRYKRGPRGAVRELTIGLGRVRDVSLATARAAAARGRAALERKEDPKVAIKGQTVDMKTFGQVADAVMDELEPSFKNDATKAHWRRTLGDHHCAALRTRPVAQVTTEDVLAVLKPLWQTKQETARKMRERIERVLDIAKVKGLRQGENPARWRGHLKLILAPQIGTRGHHKALPVEAVAEFMGKLGALDSVTALAIEWSILTLARTGEVIGASRLEVDRDKKVWTIPAKRMKEGREHRVPLTDRCLEIYDTLAAMYPASPWVFPSRDPREHLSGWAMYGCLKHMGTDATVHGFRSTFRDWAGDYTSFPREIAEAALSHLVGDEAERAYRRSDALERRRTMMAAWERFCLQGQSNVVQLLA
jgi:integrase